MEAERPASHAESESADTSPALRNARPADARAVATVLAEAFPALYRGTFGMREPSATVDLLHSLYEHGHLSLDDTRVCVDRDAVVAVMILHTGRPIGRGGAGAYWRLVRQRFGLLRAPRIFFGGITANLMLNRRIPSAPDLVYIEALAVAQSHRGQGIGSRLLSDAEAWARDRGRSRLALHVLANNEGARRLYDRAGFHPWDDDDSRPTWRSNLPPSAWTAILMKKGLVPYK